MTSGTWECWSTSTTKARKSDDIHAKRLENACWRLWNMEQVLQKDNQPQLSSSSPRSSPKKANSCSSLQQLVLGNNDVQVQGDDILQAIGGHIDFATCRFPANTDVAYDDLPTFPIRPNFASFRNSLQP